MPVAGNYLFRERMRFKDQRFFYYEQDLWYGYDLEGLFRARRLDAGLLPKTGLADLRESLLVLDEWYSQYPTITFKELATNCSTVDHLDFEPTSGKMEFGRTINIKAAIQEEDPRYNLKPSGVNLDQNIEIALGLLQLVKADYWPAPGDRIFWRGKLYDVLTVSAKPGDYFQLSGVPFHITISAEITQFEHAFLPSRALGSESLDLAPAWYHDDNAEPVDPVEDQTILPEQDGPHLPHPGSLNLEEIFTSQSGLVLISNEGPVNVELDAEDLAPSGISLSDQHTVEAGETGSSVFELPEGRWFYKLHLGVWSSDDRNKGVEIQGTCEVNVAGSSASLGQPMSIIGDSSSLELPTISMTFDGVELTIEFESNETVAVDHVVSFTIFGAREAEE